MTMKLIRRNRKGELEEKGMRYHEVAMRIVVIDTKENGKDKKWMIAEVMMWTQDEADEVSVRWLNNTNELIRVTSYCYTAVPIMAL